MYDAKERNYIINNIDSNDMHIKKIFLYIRNQIGTNIIHSIFFVN
jgi:hypothetical protein